PLPDKRTMSLVCREPAAGRGRAGRTYHRRHVIDIGDHDGVAMSGQALGQPVSNGVLAVRAGRSRADRSAARVEMQLTARQLASTDRPINQLRVITATLDFHQLVANLRAGRLAEAEGVPASRRHPPSRAVLDRTVLNSYGGGVPRPKEFDPDVALQAAMELFWEHGYEATSMAMLTERLGIGRASLYATFGDKQHLYRLAVQRYLRTRSPDPIELLSR